MEITITPAQLDWIDSMINRYHASTGIKISRLAVLQRTFENGWQISENEMAKIELEMKSSEKRKEYKHLWVVK